MASLRFEWDERKSASNKKALLIADNEHSESEDRFVLLGLSSMLRLLVVCHCYRVGGDVIRIISARKADAGERAQYAERWNP